MTRPFPSITTDRPYLISQHERRSDRRCLAERQVCLTVLCGCFFSADELPIKEFPGAYAVSTDEINQPGQHWVAFFTINDWIECFDSFGRNPGEYSVHFARWLEDTYQVVQCEMFQSRDSTVCGQYCLFFHIIRCHGYIYKDVMSVLSKNAKINQRFACKFVNKLVKLKTQEKDKYFLLQSATKKI